MTCLPCHIFGVGKEAVTRIGFGGSGCVSVSQQQQEKEFNTLDGSGTREAFILSHQDESTLRSLVISGKKKPQAHCERRVIHLQTARVICDGFVFKMCAKILQSYTQIACCARTSTNAFFRRAADILGILHNNQAAVSLSNLKLE